MEGGGAPYHASVIKPRLRNAQRRIVVVVTGLERLTWLPP